MSESLLRLDEKEIVLSHQGENEIVSDVITIGPKERLEQAESYRRQFRTRKVPSYIYRYLRYMFIQEDFSIMEYRTDEQLQNAFDSGILSESSREYETIRDLIRQSDKNKTAAHVIGLITYLSLYLGIMGKSERKTVSVHVKDPEEELDPMQRIRFMMMIMMIKDEFGSKLEKLAI